MNRTCLAAVLLLAFVSGCSPARVIRTGADCALVLPVECGRDTRVTFRVFVGADSTVRDVRPKGAPASRAVMETARCLATHTEPLDKLIARNPAEGPYEFEFGYGPMFCDFSAPD